MATLEKILLVTVALIYLAVMLFGGFNLFALLAAIVISALIRYAFKFLKGPKTVQEETMEQAGFTGLNLSGPPTQKK